MPRAGAASSSRPEPTEGFVHPSVENLMACHDAHQTFRPSELVPCFALAATWLLQPLQVSALQGCKCLCLVFRHALRCLLSSHIALSGICSWRNASCTTCFVRNQKQSRSAATAGHGSLSKAHWSTAVQRLPGSHATRPRARRCVRA